MVGKHSPAGSAALALAVLAVALLAGVGLRAGATAPKTSLTHDEAISYLSATCHQGEWYAVTFGPRPPFGTWRPASAWQRMLRVEDAGCLGRIRDDLARYDIHPPLYFWLLHGASLAAGAGMWTGAGLNVLLSALGTLALFGLALRVLGDRLRAALVALTWAVSPAVVQVFAEARQYELLGLLTILFTWQALRFAERPGRARVADAAGLAALAALGMVTHYHFALVILGVGGLLAVRRTAAMRLLAGAGALAGGAVLFLVAHPDFWRAFATQRTQAGGFVAEQFPNRLAQSAQTLSELALPSGLAPTPLGWVVAALVIGTALWLFARERGGARAPNTRPARETSASGAEATSAGPRAMVGLFLWMTAATVGLFLAFVSHGLAMTPKYLAAVWPFAAFVPVLAVVRLPVRPRAPIAAIGLVALLVSAGFSAAALHADEPPLDPTGLISRGDPVVVENVARGIFPRVVGPMRPETPVYAATQRHLAANEAEWAGELASGGVLISQLPVSDPRYGNTPAGGRRLLALLRRRASVGPGGPAVSGLGRAFTVTERRALSPRPGRR